MAPVTNSQRYHDSIYIWRDVYGIKSKLYCPIFSQYVFVFCLASADSNKMRTYPFLFNLDSVSSMMPLAKQCAFMEPSVETISGENVLTWPTVVGPNYSGRCVYTYLLALHFTCRPFSTLGI
jgi:protein arginine N-methyltransferase 6